MSINQETQKWPSFYADFRLSTPWSAAPLSSRCFKWEWDLLSAGGNTAQNREEFCSHVQDLSIWGSRARGCWVVGGFCLCQEESRLEMRGEERKAEYRVLSKNTSSWKPDLDKGKKTNINQYRCYFQASKRVLQSRFLGQESDPCPVAAVFYVPNPHLTFSILAESHHTSTPSFWNSGETAAGCTMPGNFFFNFLSHNNNKKIKPVDAAWIRRLIKTRPCWWPSWGQMGGRGRASFMQTFE